MQDVLQGRFNAKKPTPVTKWTAEHDKLTAEQKQLDREYIALKKEVSEVEQIRKGVYGTQLKRAQGIEL